MNSEGIYTGTDHLTPELIREYLNGKLNEARMHEIEMHLLECDFCADAVEGFELSSQSHVKTDRALFALRKRLNEKLRQHERPGMIRWPAWSAAAGIALAIAGYVVIRQQENEQQELAVRQSEAFLQTESNDTLLIFMPAGEELLASNEPADDRTETARDFSADGARSNAIASPGAEVPLNAAVPENKAGIAVRKPSRIQERLRFRLPDSLNYGEEVAAVKSGNLEQVERQKKPTVYIRGTTLFRNAAKQDTNEIKLVTGRVVDEEDQPLPGVSIAIGSTPAGTTTNAAGNFRLEMPENEDTLVVSLLGYESRTVSVEDTLAGLVLAMRPDEAALEEVVVVGYGKQKKRAITGAAPASSGEAVPEAGRAAYRKYLADSLRYPEEALIKRIEGEVIVGFKVTREGSLSDFRILRSLGYGCDKEAIRLIREGPEWRLSPKKNRRGQAAEATQKVEFELPRNH